MTKEQINTLWHPIEETPEYPCDILYLSDVGNMFLYRYMENGRPIDAYTPYFRLLMDGKWCYCKDISYKD